MARLPCQYSRQKDTTRLYHHSKGRLSYQRPNVKRRVQLTGMREGECLQGRDGTANQKDPSPHTQHIRRLDRRGPADQCATGQRPANPQFTVD